MVSFSLSQSVPKTATAVDVPMTVEEVAALSTKRKSELKLSGFEGKVGQTVSIIKSGEITEVLVGLGKKKEVTAATLRSSASAYARAVSKHKSVACSLLGHLKLDDADAMSAIVEGMSLSVYSFDEYKAKKSKGLSRVSILGSRSRSSLARATAIADSVRLARDFGNEPGGSLTPAVFATRARRFATEAGLGVTVWTEKRIEKEKLGGLLAVNQGSENPPRLLKLEYKPKGKAVAKIALVGKGITFDSGGLSIKTSAGMMTMKIDMGGGAAVLGAMLALPAVKAKVAVTGYIPLTDNMTGGNAQRPGDVFRARNGKTVEVLNTDAEGRLVMADALSLAAEAKPDAIVDIATLTGASTMALGTSYAALMASDDALCKRLEVAGSATDEKVWRLPLPEEYNKTLDSSVADLKNIGSNRYAGASVAGLFLQNFTDGLPWAHIDLGMSAFSEADKGINGKGATGFGVRLLVDLLEKWDA